MQDLNDKVTGNSLTAAEWNEMPTELQNIIEDSNQTLSGADLDQVGKALTIYSGVSDWYACTGSGGNFILTNTNSMQAPFEFKDGLRVRFQANHAIAGPATIDLCGLGAKPLLREDDGSALTDEIQINQFYEAWYDTLSSGQFYLKGPFSASTTQEGIAEIATQSEVDAGTDLTKYVTPNTLDGRSALTTNTGLIELATQAEVDTGTDSTRAVTPATLASTINNVWMQAAYKNSDEDRTSTTTRTADGSLNNVIDLETNTLYEIQALLYVDQNSNGTQGFSFSLSSATGGLFHLTAVYSNNVILADGDARRRWNVNGSSCSIDITGANLEQDQNIIMVHGTLEMAGVLGSMGFSWAQQASVGTATTLKAGSYIRALKIADI